MTTFSMIKFSIGAVVCAALLSCGDRSTGVEAGRGPVGGDDGTATPAALCTPLNGLRCNGLTTVQRCTRRGWVTVATCTAPQVCSAGACVTP